MKYEAVLLDMDGTVLDTIEDLKDSVNETLSCWGFDKITAAQAAANLGNGSRVLLEKSVPAGTDAKTIDEMLEFYLPYYDTHSSIKTRPFPLIPSFIEKLKAAGLKAVIISNKPDATVKALAAQFFPGMPAVGESSSVPRKPHPEMVFAAVRELGLSLEKCVYVGDTEVDIKTASNAGTDCISVSWGFRSREQLISAGASRIADNEEELFNMICE